MLSGSSIHGTPCAAHKSQGTQSTAHTEQDARAGAKYNKTDLASIDGAEEVPAAFNMLGYEQHSVNVSVDCVYAQPIGTERHNVRAREGRVQQSSLRRRKLLR